MKDTGYSPANQNYLSYWTHMFAKDVTPATMTTVYKGSIAHGLESWGNELAGTAQMYPQFEELEPPVMEGRESVKAFLTNLESTINQSLHQILVTHGS